MWPEAIAAFLLQKFLAAPIVNKLLPEIIDLKTAKSTMIAIVRAGCTVLVMCPAVTLFVSIFHNGLSWQIPLLWLPKIVLNFPFALLIQIFFIGPLVRAIFQLLFRKQLNHVGTTIFPLSEISKKRTAQN